MSAANVMMSYKDGLFRCNKCNYQCSSDREATFHNDKHTYILPRYECLSCFETVSSKSHVIKHFNRYHAVPFPEQCLLRVMSTVDSKFFTHNLFVFYLQVFCVFFS